MYKCHVYTWAASPREILLCISNSKNNNKKTQFHPPNPSGPNILIRGCLLTLLVLNHKTTTATRRIASQGTQHHLLLKLPTPLSCKSPGVYRPGFSSKIVHSHHVPVSTLSPGGFRKAWEAHLTSKRLSSWHWRMAQSVKDSQASIGT